MATGKIVGSVFFAGDQLLRMEQLAVSSCTHFIDNSWFKVHHDATRDVLSGAGLRKKRIERIIAATNGLVTRHLAIRLDAMLEAEKLPASITNLDATLAEVKAKDLTHGC